VALAGSASVNLITDTTDAHISDGSHVTTGGATQVLATDSSTMISVAGSVAVAPGGQAAIGAAVGYNLIANNITAYVDASTVHSTGSAVTVSAQAASFMV